MDEGYRAMSNNRQREAGAPDGLNGLIRDAANAAVKGGARSGRRQRNPNPQDRSDQTLTTDKVRLKSRLDELFRQTCWR
jgi:hypothetical protein